MYFGSKATKKIWGDLAALGRNIQQLLPMLLVPRLLQLSKQPGYSRPLPFIFQTLSGLAGQHDGLPRPDPDAT